MAAVGSSVASRVTTSLSRLQSLHGVFAIYKKQGPTSADVLNALKQALLKEAGIPNPRKRKKQILKMGHGGTLDSAASGVLGQKNFTSSPLEPPNVLYGTKYLSVFRGLLLSSRVFWRSLEYSCVSPLYFSVP